MEKMLITKALDERDFLAKKIDEKIRKTNFAAAIREKDKKINGLEIKDFEEKAKSEFQSIRDMIDRYNRLNKAITLSNATLKITFSDGSEMTKAEAIAKKKVYNTRDNFERKLIDKLVDDFGTASVTNDRLSREVDRQYDAHYTNLINNSGNSKLDETQLAAVEAMVAPNKPKIVDPIAIQDKIEKLSNERDVFISEVDTLLKVSNATEFVEF